MSVDLTVDRYRALARSSPWRWRTIHLSRDDWDVEAWIRRPGKMVIRRRDGSAITDSGPPQATSPVLVSTGWSPAPPEMLVPAQVRADALTPDMVTPKLRPDGLVAVRPEDGNIEWGDPFHENYTWVAALDPVELSHHTQIDDLRSEPLHGRETWWATVRAVEGYDPCCSCCALLWSAESDRLEGLTPGDGDDTGGRIYPDGYVVGLDVQTGIVVSLRSADAIPAFTTFTITIHAVDEPVPPVDVAFGPATPPGIAL